MLLGICGKGVVGSAVAQWCIDRAHRVVVYDKYKNIGSMNELLSCDYLFLCLPTVFSIEKNDFDVSAITDTLEFLEGSQFAGLVVIRSTVPPGFTDKAAAQYSSIDICFSPEFLTARTAAHDYAHQKHIILGRAEADDQDEKGPDSNKFDAFALWIADQFPIATISKTSAACAELVKLFVNTFYASKIQVFTEFQQLCILSGIDFNDVRGLMLKNGWINDAHTQIPGHDGQISYGGACFPKDTRALLAHMQRLGAPHAVLRAVTRERDTMRSDNVNVTK